MKNAHTEEKRCAMVGISIGGYIPTSFLDFPRSAAAVVFLKGCQFRCPFCHNPELVAMNGETKPIPAGQILEDLRKRKNFLDGVCISGGEPTIQPGLIPFLDLIRAEGLKIKLDTNGARPDVLEQVLVSGKADYIAMDVKAPWEKYPFASGWTGDIEAVKKSIFLLLDSKTAFEFRTTLVPGIHSHEDASRIGRMIEGAPLYVLQNFRPGHTLSPDFSGRDPFPPEFLEAFREMAAPFAEEVRIRR